ncbi:MAG: glycosyltransferase family 2 protein [Actinomycetota bacterium]|nr:glycosyltransferase family 2 protein [Actinomycetota bacterium]
MRKIAIVPALNEEQMIARVIEEIRAFDADFEVVVVDDGSTDRTALVAERAGAQVIRLPFNLGIGGAVQAGYQYAVERDFDVAVQIDGDGQHDPGELPKILIPLIEGEADIVIGSRFAEAQGYRAPLARRLGMHVFSGLLSVIARQRLTDTSSAFRALNRRSLSLFARDYPHGFLETVEATVLAVKHGLRLKEVPVRMRPRESGTSSLTVFLSLFYAAKVLVAVFVSLFRRSLVHMEEER